MKYGETLRLPLWKNLLENILADNPKYGQFFETSFFEEKLKCKKDKIEYVFAISQIRAGLEERGFYLSGRGYKGKGYQILPANCNAAVMQSYQKEASKALGRALILGSNTDLNQLNDQEKRRHESMLERTAVKTALMARSQEFGKILKKEKQDLLT